MMLSRVLELDTQVRGMTSDGVDLWCLISPFLLPCARGGG